MCVIWYEVRCQCNAQRQLQTFILIQCQEVKLDLLTYHNTFLNLNQKMVVKGSTISNVIFYVVKFWIFDIFSLLKVRYMH